MMEKEMKSMTRRFGILAVVAVILNLVFWGGLIWIALELLTAYGIIG